MASYVKNLFGSGSKSNSWLPFSGSSSSGGVTDTVKNAVASVNPFSSSPAPGVLDKAKSLVPGLGSSSSSGGITSLLFGPKDETFFTKIYNNLGFSSTIATLLGYVSYILYQQFVNKDPRTAFEFIKSHLGQIVSAVPFADKIPGLSTLISKVSTGGPPTPEAAKNALAALRARRPSLLSKLNPLKWDMFNKKAIKAQKDDEAYQAGESYGDPEVVSTGLVDDLKAIGLKGAPKDIEALIGIVKGLGKPLDDRQMDVEKIIALAASLPTHSKARQKLTGVLIDVLWSSLQHPPLSYMGNKYAYRSPDGSNNNPMFPDLGKAGSPYARTVKKVKHLKGCQPDPGLLFDHLMARTETSFKENPAGVSSMLFYHATIIIHDIFNSNRFDHNISDTSSYLDLAPLYGSSLSDQLSIRTMKGGLLKPDTFAEKRLLGQPPGVNVVLVMYSRFHNYCAETLLKINEYDRFSLPKNITSDEQMAAAQAKQDEDLFQTARLITNGLYINICLYDYLRGLTNTHHSASDWTLDPRVQVDRLFDPDGVPRGCGNQISAEFNLLYRFHSTISLRDEKWMNEFMGNLFPDINKPFDQLTPQEFITGLYRFEQSIPKEPEKREFAGIKRGGDGKFNDADLTKILKESCEDPAGLFGPRMVPKALKMVEIAGILSSRKWNLASLNEMRDFFKLKRHDTFEDLNPDPEIADLLRKFYQHPDMVEMYPGLFLEDGKPRMDPGCGGCPPYTVGRAVFSDAVTLVRSDRFLTLDYTSATLTNWGMTEVAYDLRVMGGSMYYKLIQRALPGWFPYNSLHIMQPMFTRKMNEEIAKEIGTIDLYTKEDPKPPAKPILIANADTIQKVLGDQTNFKVPWNKPFSDLFPGKKDYSSYMLAADKAENTAQRNLLGGILYASPDITRLISDTTLTLGDKIMKKNTFVIGKSLNQIDIIRDVAIPMNARIMNDLFCLDLKTEDSPTGSLTTNQLYKYLTDVRTWGFDNTDPAMAWKRRMWAQEGSKALEESTNKSVKQALAGAAVGAPAGIVSTVVSGTTSILSKVPIVGGLFGGGKPAAGATAPAASGAQANATLKWFGGNMVKELAKAGQTPAQIADICWLTAVAGIGVPVGVFASVMEYFLKPENSKLWGQIQEIASSGSSEAVNKALRPYILEAQRLTSTQQDLRICAGSVKIGDQEFKPGNVVVTLLGLAGQNPATVPDAAKFQLDRPAEAYLHFGSGPHKCLGREVTIAFVAGLVRLLATTQALRPAPDKMGHLKVVMMGPGNTEKLYMNDSWSYLTKDPSTWTLHFDGYGRGVYQAPAVDVGEGRDLATIFDALKAQAKNPPKIPDVVANADSMPPPPIDSTSSEAREIAKGATNKHGNVSDPSQDNSLSNGVSGATNKLGLSSDSPTEESVPSIDDTASKNDTVQAAPDDSTAAGTDDAVETKPDDTATAPQDNAVQAGSDDTAVASNNDTAQAGADTTAADDDNNKDPVQDITADTGDDGAVQTGPDTTATTTSGDTATAPPDNTTTVTSDNVKIDTSGNTATVIPDNTATATPDVSATAPTNDDASSKPAQTTADAPLTTSRSPYPMSDASSAAPATETGGTTTPVPTNPGSSTAPPPATTIPDPQPADLPAPVTAPEPAKPAEPVQPAEPVKPAAPEEPADGFDPSQPVCKTPQSGALSVSGDYNAKKGAQGGDRFVKFKQQYEKPPRVVLSITRLDISASGSAADFSQTPTNITRTGFVWSTTIPGTQHWALESSWLAIPDTDDYKDVVTATFDSRTDGTKDTTKNRYLKTLDVGALRGTPYNVTPTVVMWISGFTIDAGGKLPPSVKLRADKGDKVNGSQVDIAVNCSNLNQVKAVQVNVILIPSLFGRMVGYYHNSYDTAIPLPFVPPPQTRTSIFITIPLIGANVASNMIGLSGFDFSKTGTSLRYQSSMTQGITQWNATIGTWFDGAPNSVTAWIINC